MNESSLASLAILKVNWDISGKDYVESFVPFAIECIRTSGDDAVSLPSLQERLMADFGLDIPFNPLKMILVRAAKLGYLRREHGIFIRNPAACNETGFRDRQLKVEATHDLILKKLVNYAKEKHSVELKNDEARSALHGFLRDNSLRLLFTVSEGGLVAGPRERSGPSFIVGSFISDAQTTDRQVIEDMVTLVQGNLLSNALYMPDPGRIKQRFKDTRVYLDTSILAYAAGYAGPTCAAPSLELLNLLKAHGAELFCFRHTRDELKGILDACAGRLRQGNLRDSFGPSMEYFIETGRTASDVELLAARMNEKLRSLGVTIDEKPPYEKTHLIGEKAFEEAIDSEIRYSSPKARINDVDSISAIARLRRGREAIYPELSWALFVTTNSALAKVTRRFFQSDSSPGSVALCMTDYALGNLLWLKNPTHAPNLPHKQLLAHAYAALQPPDHLWKKYLAETARLQDEGTISADDYYILRYSLAAKSALMDLTQGGETAFSEGTVKQVLAIAEEKLRADLKEAITREQESRRVAENQIQKYEEERLICVERLRLKASKVAIKARLFVFMIGSVIIGLAICYTFPWSLPRPIDALGRYSLSGALFILLLLSFGNLIWGATLSSALKKFEQRIEAKLGELFIRFAGLDQVSNSDKNTPK